MAGALCVSAQGQSLAGVKSVATARGRRRESRSDEACWKNKSSLVLRLDSPKVRSMRLVWRSLLSDPWEREVAISNRTSRSTLCCDRCRKQKCCSLPNASAMNSRDTCRASGFRPVTETISIELGLLQAGFQSL